MDHEIIVTLGDDGRVTALENPLVVDPEDTVTWICRGGAAGRGLRVEFRDGNPFDQLRSAVTDQIRGTVRPDAEHRLHIYNIFEGDTRLEWANPIPDRGNFGGIEIPRPPGGP